MRDYDEVTQAILKRRDEQIAKDKRRAITVKRCAAAALACCAAAVIGTGIVRYDKSNFAHPDITDVTPAETTGSGSGNESITTTYNSNDTVKITTALSEAAAEITRKRADENIIVTSPAEPGAFCTVTLKNNESSDTASKNNDVTSSGRVTVASVTTTVTPSAVSIHEERMNMQRLPAYLSALTASMSTVFSKSVTDYHVNSDRYPKQKNGIENITKNGMTTDLDSDGSSDLTDCFLLSLYCMADGNKSSAGSISDEVTQNIILNADYNNDGSINYDDAYILICDYLLNNRVTYKDVHPGTYDPDFSGSINLPVFYDSDEASFARMVSDMSHQLLIDQYIIEDMVENDILDLDVNEDGVVDITDFTYLMINGENYLDSYVVPVEGGYATAPRPHTIELPDNIRKNCDKVFYARPFLYYDNSYEVSMFISGLGKYYASHTILMPEYFENDFYDDIIDYAGEYSIGDKLRSNAMDIGIIPDENSYFRFDNELFESGFRTYCDNVMSGKQPEPDLNMDGVVDHKDYDLASAYIFEVAAEHDENSVTMPVNIWKNINSRCDFNQNGTSGDIYDIFFAQIYVLLTEDDTADTDTGSEAYPKDPDTISGDVNCDGSIDMADAVLIMQYLSNPNKYQISEHGISNGDADGRDNGITLTDVLAIQNYLLNVSHSDR